MPAQLEVSDGECGGSRYDGSCSVYEDRPRSVFNPCMLSVLSCPLTYLADENLCVYSFI